MIGQNAPDFTLKNTAKEPVSLSNYRGSTVILAFYPGAFTGVCDKEMCAFQDNMA
ncbi:MAG: peroxiredoxin, partial [Crocinitomicaceae bacterium]|nr:peroxiredoxin [Crocinitomicaceae bacterium]